MQRIIPTMTLILLVFFQLPVAKSDELNDLKEQLAEQTQKLQETQQRLEQLETRQMQKEKSPEKQVEELKKQEPGAAPADFRVYWKEGLNLTTLDGDFKLKIGGRLQTDWLWTSEDDEIK